LGKKKVYELAKELNTNSKELIEKLKTLNIEVKSHMTVLEDDAVEKVSKLYGKEEPSKKGNEGKSMQNETKNPTKKKKDEPRIIRREIVRVEETVEEKKPEEPIGFIEELKPKKAANPEQFRRNEDNQRKKAPIPSIKDLFKKPEEEKKPELKNEVVEEKPVVKEEPKEEKKVEVKKEEVKSKENHVNNERRDSRPNKKPFNRDNNSNNNQQDRKPRPNNNNNNKPFNKQSGRPNNQRPQGNNVEKSIKEVISAPQTTEQKVSRDAKDFKPRNNNNNGEQQERRNNRNQRGNQNSKFDKGSFRELRTGHKVSDILNEDDSVLLNFYDFDNRNKRNKKKKVVENKEFEHTKILPFSITVGDSITVKDLAEKLKKTSSEVIKKLMGYGIIATLNHEVDYDTAAIMAEEFGVKIEKAVVVTEEDILFEDEADVEENLQPRPPVVVVMGHVDHGKTSLLDAIRETHVTDKEAGGITQHIGASTVTINGKKLTFLDTPGHEAFTAMRARGAQITDIAILVVAADDGIMPQTVEAINHAKAAGVSIIVAINKIDKPEANPDRVKQELMNYGIVPEEWGGDAICVPVSAKHRMGIENLLETVTLVAEVMELKADPERQAKGTVIESKLDKGRGPVATVLVQRGTLRLGDTVIVGDVVGHVRAMNDYRGKKIKKAGPSIPAEIVGLSEVPLGGDTFYSVKDEKIARQLVEKRKRKKREETLRASSRVSLDDLFNQIQQGDFKELNIIVKADVQGSVEAVKQSLEKLSNDEVHVKVIHSGVGAVSESDVTLAQVANAIVIGFNVKPDAIAASIADREGVDLRLYTVIYSAIDDIESAMKGMLDPKYREQITGHGEIRDIIKVPNVGMVAGTYVTSGKLHRGSKVRVIRDNIVVFEGNMASLRRFKDDVKDVAEGYECGVSIENYNDIKIGDVIEGFIMEEIKQ